MAWQNPKTNWKAGDVPSSDDFNRIESNIQHVKDEIDNVELDAENINLNSSKFSSNNVKDGMEELFTSVSDGKQKIAAAITDMGQSASGSDTFEQLSDKIKDISKDANAATNHVLSGKTFYQGGSKKIGTMPNRGAINKTITTQGGQIYIPAGYHNGSGIVKAQFANLTPENIKKDVNVGGIVGTLDIGYKKYVIDNHDGDNVDLVVSYISNRKVVIADNIPSGRKKYILYDMYQPIEYIDTLPWSGKFRVWTSKEVYLTKIEQLTDTSLELTFVNEEEISYDARFDILIFYI